MTHIFNINYQQEHLAFVQRMAIITEKVHKKYSPSMRWTPEKTAIVINDSLDSSNGESSPSPDNKLFI